MYWTVERKVYDVEYYRLHFLRIYGPTETTDLWSFHYTSTHFNTTLYEVHSVYTRYQAAMSVI